MRLRDGARWRVHVCLQYQRFGVQISKIKVKFVDAIGRIERGTCRTSSHGEKSHGHLRAIRQHQSNPVIAAQSHSTQRLHHIVNVAS